MLIESLSGVRGFDQELTPEIVRAYAFALRLSGNCQKVVVGRDSRPSGLKLQKLMMDALQSCGVEVIDLGICPTPTVQIAVTHQKADNGIVITASHNPLPWNGLKFIGADGLFLDKQQMEQLRAMRLKLSGWRPMGVKLGTYREYPFANRDHIESILQLSYLQVDKIQERRFKIVVDAVNGAASHIIPELLTKLGCEVIPLYCNPQQSFPHTPEPLPENLLDLEEQVRASKADLGLAIDPDGDRLAIISDEGKPISEEYTLVLTAWLVLARSQVEPKIVVTNLSTTRAVDDIAQRYGAQVLRTPIGEINVAQKMWVTNAVIGGEGNGGVILPEAHLGRDSLVGAALILQLLTEKKKSISQLMQELPHYFMLKKKVTRGDLNFATIQTIVQNNAAGATVNLDDGIKLSWSDSWIHIRPSNTEPIVRIYCEATSLEHAEALVQRYTDLIQSH